MPIDQKLISEIVNRVLAVVQAERVALFGSAACGEMTRKMDTEGFDESEDVVGSILYPANKYGKVIYAAG